MRYLDFEIFALVHQERPDGWPLELPSKFLHSLILVCHAFALPILRTLPFSVIGVAFSHNGGLAAYRQSDQILRGFAIVREDELTGPGCLAGLSTEYAERRRKAKSRANSARSW